MSEAKEENVKTELEKMLQGEMYDAFDPVLLQMKERNENKRKGNAIYSTEFDTNNENG